MFALTPLAARPSVSRRTALKILERIRDRWKLDRKDLPHLLGGISPRTLRYWFEHEGGQPLGPDVLERISHLVAIYDALHRLFNGNAEYADRWIAIPNDAFGGRPPLDILLAGGFTGLVEIRRYLDIALLS